jgi:hypothetical protein
MICTNIPKGGTPSASSGGLYAESRGAIGAPRMNTVIEPLCIITIFIRTILSGNG